MKLMKNNLYTFIGIVASILLIWSCSKDKGNYTYTDVNTLHITTDMSLVDPTVFITPDSIDIHQNDSLKVKLKIVGTSATETDYSFQWYITQFSQSSANPPLFLIDSVADLNTKITLTPNVYKLVAKVMDLKTGISFYKAFSLNVSGAEWGGEGWVVLQETASGSDISVITTRDGSTRGQIFRDIYFSSNGHKLPIGTNKVNVINYPNAIRAQKVSFLYPNGALEVRSSDFADSSKADSWFVGLQGELDIQLNGSAGSSGSGFEYAIVNNQISYRQFASAAHIATPPLFFPPFVGLSVAPFVINAAAADYIYTLYDNVNKGFTLFNASTSLQPNIPNYNAPISNLNPETGQGFDLKNMGDHLIHAENVQPINASIGIYWNCFFRNENKTNTYLVQFPRGTAYLNNFTTGRFQLKEENCPGINNATLFANPTCLPMPMGVFYYVNDHQIYTSKVNTLANSTAIAGLTFKSGTIIKTMKVFNSGYTIANINAMGVPEGKVLVVATDESASGGGNNVYFFNIDSKTGDILGSTTSPADVYTGFEKITDVTFKKAIGR
jgi:hypothetical protein